MLFASPSPGIGAVRLGELYLEILAKGSITGERAVAAFSAIVAVNYGRTAFVTNAPDEDLPLLPAELFPHSAANFDALSAYASQENYERAMEIVLAGITAAR
jgi:hypothetical protein